MAGKLRGKVFYMLLPVPDLQRKLRTMAVVITSRMMREQEGMRQTPEPKGKREPKPGGKMSRLEGVALLHRSPSQHFIGAIQASLNMQPLVTAPTRYGGNKTISKS